MLLELPQLPYAYEALEPAISREIMELHHKKHHQAYINNYKAALEKYNAAEKEGRIDQMIALQSALKFNGGGHVNHTLFWENLAPKDQVGEPSKELIQSIETYFGSLDKLIEEMTAKSAGVQGSGWGWLAIDPQKKCLYIVTCQNQDPASSQGVVPLLGIDVWEHAYYLQYKNVRPDYLKAIWQVINWNCVNKRFESALS